MPGTAGPTKVSKKAIKQYKKLRDKPVTKRYGKAVMKDDPNKPGRRIGYATTTKTELPAYKPRKRTNKQSRKNLKKVRGK